MITRRKLILGLASVGIAGPYVVRNSGLLMPVKNRCGDGIMLISRAHPLYTHVSRKKFDPLDFDTWDQPGYYFDGEHFYAKTDEEDPQDTMAQDGELWA